MFILDFDCLYYISLYLVWEDPFLLDVPIKLLLLMTKLAQGHYWEKIGIFSVCCLSFTDVNC